MNTLAFTIAAVIVAASFGLEIKKEIDIRKGSYTDNDSYRLGKVIKKMLFDRENDKDEEN